MSRRLHSSEPTTSDTVQYNDCSFPPLQGSGGKFLRFYQVYTCSGSSCPVRNIVAFRRLPRFRLWIDLENFFLYTLVKWDGSASLHLVQMLCFGFSLISTSQVTLGIGSLSKVASVLLAPLLARESAFSFLK